MKIDNSVAVIRGVAIDKALEKEYRQYLTGKLTREQKYLPHIDDEIEVGISYYREFTADKPHKHPIATEHGYVLQGTMRMKLLDGSENEYEFGAGDFFVVPKGVPCATKNSAETKVLFIKSPGINDKTLVESSEDLSRWLSCWDI